jgi:hypothetical protein
MLSQAERLARALRSGLELRWSIPASRSTRLNPFPPHGDIRAFLEPYAEALEYRLPRRRKPLHRFIRAVHYLMRKLFAPWLHIQAHFNLSTISVIEQVEQRVRALEDAERTLQRAVEMLQKTNLEKS